MAKLQWDEIGSRLFETGVDRGVLFPMGANNTYQTGVAWNGLTAVNESPSGAEPNDLWADNIKYATLRSAEQFGATIEAYTYPDEFAECDGSKAMTTGVNVSGQTRKMFAFSYRTLIGSDTDGMEKGYKVHIVYGCTANPSEKSRSTVNEDPDAITFSWEITSTGIPMEGYKPIAHLEVDSTKVSSENLTAFENKLYGTDGQNGTSPTLVMPSDIATLFPVSNGG